jgi:hypothetical protein
MKISAMDSIQQYGDIIIKLSKFVGQLDGAVKVEAFKFLLAREIEAPGNREQLAPHMPRDRNLSPQELIRKSTASKFSEKAVVLAYWLEEHQKKNSFSSTDLKAAFDQAREKTPQNMSDTVAKLEAAAQFMKAEKNGAIQHYRLTSTAINEVEAMLNIDAAK